jgi:purine-nucleoside/S-methyl-5'-thioadenosine phosphorylase / adenosine deaminase
MVSWHGKPPTHAALPALEAVGVRHAFTTRHQGSFDGVSAPAGPFGVDRSWPALAALGLESTSVRYARQVHGDVCIDADLGTRAGLMGTGDALFTRRRMRPLAVFTADCVPLIVVDPERPALGVAHAGWRGTVRGIAGRLVAALVEQTGARVDRIRAAIGPSIGPCCYEVDEPVIGEFTRTYGADRLARWSRASRSGHVMLDLWSANEDLLVDAGVERTRIDNARLCTACHPELLYSYRKGNRGRLVTVAAL